MRSENENTVYWKIAGIPFNYPVLHDTGIFRLGEAPYLFNIPSGGWVRPQYAEELQCDSAAVIADNIADIGVLVLSDAFSPRWTEMEQSVLPVYFVPTAAAELFENSLPETKERKDWDLLLSVAPIIYDARAGQRETIYIDGLDIPAVKINGCSPSVAWRLAGHCLVNILRAICNNKQNKPDGWSECWNSILAPMSDVWGKSIMKSTVQALFEAFGGGRAAVAATYALAQWEKDYDCRDLCFEYVLKQMCVLTGDDDIDRDLVELYKCLGALEVWNKMELRSPYKSGKIIMESQAYPMIKRINRVRRASGIDAMLSLILDYGVPLEDALR